MIEDMPNKRILLTLHQAVNAIQIDFQQYATQLLLFSAILKLISHQQAYLTLEPPKNGAWLHEAGRTKLRWLDGSELVAYMCKAMAEADLAPELLASVCSRVFQTTAYVHSDQRTAQSRICIETGMEEFECRQCGQCCHSLDYNSELTTEDVARWKTLGRQDILDWVGTFKHNDAKDPTYRIWMIRDTRELARTCPFLIHVPTENSWICGIHSVKPSICRNYPVSRKHAIMTGCQGFDSRK